jgi:hypothetical protein
MQHDEFWSLLLLQKITKKGVGDIVGSDGYVNGLGGGDDLMGYICMSKLIGL